MQVVFASVCRQIITMSVRHSRRLLAAYVVQNSDGHGVPFPSTFTENSFTIEHSDHVTMQVLFQEIISYSNSKSRVSETYLQNNTIKIPS
jgi:hypothetical protein